MTTTRPTRATDDRGAALLLTLFATTLVMILGTTILSATVNNLRSTRLSQDAGAALDAADAGLSQVAAHLRTYGVRGLACAPTCTSGYGSRTSPAAVTMPTLRGAPSRRYEVWVEPLAPLPANNPGLYRIHSTGYAGQAVRAIVADVSLGTQPIGLPLAIFAKSVDGGGSASVTRISILSTGCVDSRRQILTQGIDVGLGIPAAVHSSQYISELQQTSVNCGPGRASIHQTGNCNAEFPWDQSVQGGPLPGGSSACSGARANYYYQARDVDGDGSTDVTGSKIKDANSLRKLFGIPEQPFTESQLDNLRAVAQSQGTYFTRATYSPSDIPTPAQQPNTVLFFDLLAGPDVGQVVDLKDVNGWGRAPNPTTCPTQSLLIVITGGDARLNGNETMAANIVLTSSAPYGHVFKANGTARLIGTIYADALDLTGNVDISLDTCFLQNLSPSLVDTTFTVTSYREVDRTG